MIPISLLVAAGLAGTALGCGARDDAPPPPPREADRSPTYRELSAALREPDAFLRVRRLSALLPTLGPEALPDIQEAIRLRRRDMGGTELEMVMRRWAELDPAGAVARSLDLETARARTVALHVAVQTWAEADPEAAREGITPAVESPFADAAQTAQQALVRGWFRADRPGLEAYMQGLPHGPQRMISLSRFTLDLLQAEGPDALIEWAAATPEDDPRYKRSAFSLVTAGLLSASPEAVERWCEAQCDGPYGGPAIRALVAEGRLNRGENEQAVLEWLALDPRGQAGEQSLVGTFARWSRRDRESAMAWMEEQLAADPQPAWLPILYAPYAQVLSLTSPVEAVAWTEHIADESEREDVIVSIVREWLSREPQAAESWLSESPLSEATRMRARGGRAPRSAKAPRAEAATESAAP